MNDIVLLSAQTPKAPSPAASTPCLTIESGVPMPARSKHRGGKARYPWRQMAPGDSFVFPAKSTIRRTYNNAQAAVAYRKAGHGETYRVRMVDENGERVVRVWRVK